jgi:biotin carboxyl carrier protein
VEVVEGQAVEAGQALLKVEAMKMEHTLVAPRRGVVTALDVSRGSQVLLLADRLLLHGCVPAETHGAR